MTYFIVYVIIAILIEFWFLYEIGKRYDENGDDGHVSVIMLSVALSVFWLPVIAIVVCSPFYFVHRLGVKKTRIEKHKNKMWDNLKK